MSSDVRIAEPLETSITFGQRQTDALTRLLDACNEASADPETDPVTIETFGNAEDFLGALPSRIPLPDVMVHPDGEIAFEWHRARNRVLTVSLGATSSLAFASLFGENTTYGRLSFAGAFPEEIAHLLDRLYPTQVVCVSR